MQTGIWFEDWDAGLLICDDPSSGTCRTKEAAKTVSNHRIPRVERKDSRFLFSDMLGPTHVVLGCYVGHAVLSVLFIVVRLRGQLTWFG